MFDWNDLRYFLAVAREGSSLAAAKALGVSQPTVQRRLAVGLAVLPVHVGDLQTDLVRVIEPTAELNSRVYLLMHPDLRNTPRARAFFDFVVAEIDGFRPVLRGEPQNRRDA